MTERNAVSMPVVFTAVSYSANHTPPCILSTVSPASTKHASNQALYAIAEDRESYIADSAVLTQEEIEQLEERFWSLATGSEVNTRRVLFSLLGKSVDEIADELKIADTETRQAFFAIAESGFEMIQALKHFVDVLEGAQWRLEIGLDKMQH
ncbi:MAG: hypothetical protein ACRBHB_07665 [Arenicella sp.]